ncbi:MAG: hypothetical protein KGI97_06455 [Alphaproteobacteria bacterium]|nr:hypothetical protein [Alphaproteobacteria bacterium]
MNVDNGVKSKNFRGADGETEHYIAVHVPEDLPFAEQLKLLQERYEEAQKELGLTPETAIFRRIFLSDALNQAAVVRETDLVREAPDNPVAVSIVQQPSLPDSKIALLAYHINGRAKFAKKRLSAKHLLLRKNGKRHLWSTRLCGGLNDLSAGAAEQTLNIFNDLIDTLADLGGNLKDHTVRTWIYMKDVDVFYKDMVESRNVLFSQQRLTSDTHYIASTGIEGACAHQFDLVSMDSYSALDMDPERQRSFLNDFTRLCPTNDYNVTFERGTRVAYADRAHHFISGTASIDNIGRVVHPGDVMKQLDRTLENIDALLRSGSARIEDMAHMIVYMRDPTDYSSIAAALRERLPDVPAVIVQGAVCRPEWLIEIEGIAISANDDFSLPSF